MVTKDGTSPMKRSPDKARGQTEPEVIMTVNEVAQYPEGPCNHHLRL